MSAGREGFPEEREKLKSKKEMETMDRNASRSDSRNLSKPKFLEVEPNRQTSQQPNPTMSNSSVPEIPYQFADPCPTSMRDVNITDLSSVNINWKMLTLARPKTKTDEEIFSK